MQGVKESTRGHRRHPHRFTLLIAASVLMTAIFVSPASAQTRIISLGGDLDFGSVPFNASSARTLAIFNYGNTDLTVSNISYPAVPAYSQASFQGNWSGIIPPNSAQFVPITFTPKASGLSGDTNNLDIQGYLTVQSDATSGNNSAFLSGVATWPPLPPGPNLDCGTLPIESYSGLNLTLTNIGPTPVTVSNVSVPSGFLSSGYYTFKLNPGAATTVFVTFHPTAVADYHGLVSISSDATAPVLVLVTTNGNVTNSPLGYNSFSVSGTGTYPTGSFVGLFVSTNNPTFESSGYFTADCIANGSLHAIITLAGKRYPFAAQISPTGTASAAIRRKGLPDLNVSLTFTDFARQQGVFISGGWIGTVSDGTWTAQLGALRVFPPGRNAGGGGRGGGIAGGSNPGFPNPRLSNSRRSFFPQKFPFNITGSTNASVAPTAPGTGTITITEIAHVKGILGDGTRYSQTTPFSGESIPFYTQLYGHKGAILGWMSFQVVLPIVEIPRQTNPPAGPGFPPATITPVIPILSGDANPILPPTISPVEMLAQSTNTAQLQIVGTLNWFKPAGIDANYPDGFSFQTTVSGSVPFP